MGKGSKPRPMKKQAFDQNFDEINWKSKTSPKTTPCKETDIIEILSTPCITPVLTTEEMLKEFSR